MAKTAVKGGRLGRYLPKFGSAPSPETPPAAKPVAKPVAKAAVKEGAQEELKEGEPKAQRTAEKEPAKVEFSAAMKVPLSPVSDSGALEAPGAPRRQKRRSSHMHAKTRRPSLTSPKTAARRKSHAAVHDGPRKMMPLLSVDCDLRDVEDEQKSCDDEADTHKAAQTTAAASPLSSSSSYLDGFRKAISPKQKLAVFASWPAARVLSESGESGEPASAPAQRAHAHKSPLMTPEEAEDAPKPDAFASAYAAAKQQREIDALRHALEAQTNATRDAEKRLERLGLLVKHLERRVAHLSGALRNGTLVLLGVMVALQALNQFLHASSAADTIVCKSLVVIAGLFMLRRAHGPLASGDIVAPLATTCWGEQGRGRPSAPPGAQYNYLQDAGIDVQRWLRQRLTLAQREQLEETERLIADGLRTSSDLDHTRYFVQPDKLTALRHLIAARFSPTEAARSTVQVVAWRQAHGVDAMVAMSPTPAYKLCCSVRKFLSTGTCLAGRPVFVERYGAFLANGMAQSSLSLEQWEQCLHLRIAAITSALRDASIAMKRPVARVTIVVDLKGVHTADLATNALSRVHKRVAQRYPGICADVLVTRAPLAAVPLVRMQPHVVSCVASRTVAVVTARELLERIGEAALPADLGGSWTEKTNM